MKFHSQATDDQNLHRSLHFNKINQFALQENQISPPPHFFPLESNSSHADSTANPAPAGGALDAGPDSPNLIWRVLLDDRIGADELLINISTNQLLTEGDGLLSSEMGPAGVDLSSVELDGPFGINETLEFTLGRKRNESGDSSYQNKTVQGGGRPSGRSNRTR